MPSSEVGLCTTSDSPDRSPGAGTPMQGLLLQPARDSALGVPDWGAAGQDG